MGFIKADVSDDTDIESEGEGPELLLNVLLHLQVNPAPSFTCLLSHEDGGSTSPLYNLLLIEAAFQQRSNTHLQ